MTSAISPILTSVSTRMMSFSPVPYRFFGLPADLRTLVYRFLFDQSEICFTISIDSPEKYPNLEERLSTAIRQRGIQPWREIDQYLRKQASIHTDAAEAQLDILRTCRTIRNEAMPFFFRGMKLVMKTEEISDNFSMSFSYSQFQSRDLTSRLKRGFLSQIRSLHLGGCKIYMRALSKMSSLETIHIHPYDLATKSAIWLNIDVPISWKKQHEDQPWEDLILEIKIQCLYTDSDYEALQGTFTSAVNFLGRKFAIRLAAPVRTMSR